VAVAEAANRHRQRCARSDVEVNDAALDHRPALIAEAEVRVVIAAVPPDALPENDPNADLLADRVAVDTMEHLVVAEFRGNLLRYRRFHTIPLAEFRGDFGERCGPR